MSIKYKIYHEQNLLVDIMDGLVGLPELEKVFRFEVADENFKGVTKILSSIVDAQMNVTLDDLQKFIAMLSTPDSNPAFKWAILTSKPDQTAFSILLKNDKHFIDIVGVFSTLEACNMFLEISFNQENFLDDDYVILE